VCETILLLLRLHSCLYSYIIRYVLIIVCFSRIGHPQVHTVLTFTIFIYMIVLPTLASVYTVGVLVQVSDRKR
jgi:hypothetical protein